MPSSVALSMRPVQLEVVYLQGWWFFGVAGGVDVPRRRSSLQEQRNTVFRTDSLVSGRLYNAEDFNTFPKGHFVYGAC